MLVLLRYMSLASSLPPLDFPKFSEASARRLEAQVSALTFNVTRAEEAQASAQRIAELRYDQAMVATQGLKACSSARATPVAPCLLHSSALTIARPSSPLREGVARDVRESR